MSEQRATVAALVVLLVACPAPAPTPMELEPPTLEVPATSSDQPWRLPRLTLRAVAGDDTVVQLFVSADCSGPELLRRPIDAFREGVELDAVSGRNVFTATVLTRAGLRSRCSPAVSVEVRLPMRGPATAPEVLATSVRSPTKERSVSVMGYAEDGWTVRVWSKRDCEGIVLATGDASAFAEPGLAVPLQPNERLDVSLDATRGYELSRCSFGTERLENDSEPPTFSVRFFPTPPHPFRANALLVTDLEVGATVRVRAGVSCDRTAAAGTAYCENDCCDWLLFPLPVDATLSLWATDFAGNESPCLQLQQQSSPQGAPLTSPLWTTQSRRLLFASPTGFDAKLYPSADCTGLSVPGNSTTVDDLTVFVANDMGVPSSARLTEPPPGVDFPCVRVR